MGDRRSGRHHACPLALSHKERFRRRGWRMHVYDNLQAIGLLLCLFKRWRTALTAFLSISIYWLGDIACLWAALHVFYAHTPPVAQLLVGYASGYALTRRTLPLGGAGIVESFCRSPRLDRHRPRPRPSRRRRLPRYQPVAATAARPRRPPLAPPAATRAPTPASARDGLTRLTGRASFALPEPEGQPLSETRPLDVRELPGRQSPLV